MQTASFTGFIKVVFIIVFIYYGLKLLFRIFAPIFLQYIVKKAENNFRTHHGHYDSKKTSSNSDHKTDESVFAKPKRTNIVGDYVDYEEID